MNSIEVSGSADRHQFPQYLFIVVNLISAIVSTVGNSLVLVTIWRTPRLHSPSNVLLAGLALCDLGVGLICQPTWIITEMRSNKARAIVVWIYVLSAEFFVDVSFVTLTAISIDRYLALRLHLRFRQLVTVKRVVILLVVLWMANLFVFVWAVFHYYSVFILQLLVLFMFVLLTIFCYFKILKIVRRHQAQIQSQLFIRRNAELTLAYTERKRNSVLSMLYIVGIFIISYIPWLSVSVSSCCIRELDSTFWKPALSLLFANSSVNQVLYCWQFTDLRQAAKEIVSRVCSQHRR